MIKTTLTIRDMRCGMCESHINNVIRQNFTVKKVKSSHKKNCTEILTEESLDQNAVIQAIEQTGYKVSEYKEETYVKKGLFGF